MAEQLVEYERRFVEQLQQLGTKLLRPLFDAGTMASQVGEVPIGAPLQRDVASLAEWTETAVTRLEQRLQNAPDDAVSILCEYVEDTIRAHAPTLCCVARAHDALVHLIAVQDGELAQRAMQDALIIPEGPSVETADLLPACSAGRPTAAVQSHMVASLVPPRSCAPSPALTSPETDCLNDSDTAFALSVRKYSAQVILGISEKRGGSKHVLFSALARLFHRPVCLLRVLQEIVPSESPGLSRVQAVSQAASATITKTRRSAAALLRMLALSGRMRMKKHDDDKEVHGAHFAVFDSDVPLRRLILEQPMRRATRHGRWRRFVFHLFSDVLVYSDVASRNVKKLMRKESEKELWRQFSFGNGDRVIRPDIVPCDLTVHRVLPLNSLSVTADADPTCFVVRSPEKSFVVRAEDAVTASAWIAAVEQAISNVGNEKQQEAPVWEADSANSTCRRCGVRFTVVRRRHHCRRCGCVCCGKCSQHRHLLTNIDERKPVRVCDACRDQLQSQSHETRDTTAGVTTESTESETSARKHHSLLGELAMREVEFIRSDSAPPVLLVERAPVTALTEVTEVARRLVLSEAQFHAQLRALSLVAGDELALRSEHVARRCSLSVMSMAEAIRALCRRSLHSAQSLQQVSLGDRLPDQRQKATTPDLRERTVSLATSATRAATEMYLSAYGGSIPRVLHTLLCALLTDGLTTGLFRLAGSHEAVAEVYTKMKRGHAVPQELVEREPHVAADLFKQVLRESGTPLAHLDFGDVVTPFLDKDARTKKAAEFLANVETFVPDVQQRALFLFTLDACAVLSLFEEETRMGLHQLALVFAPSVFSESRLSPKSTSDPAAAVAEAMERVDAAVALVEACVLVRSDAAAATRLQLSVTCTCAGEVCVCAASVVGTGQTPQQVAQTVTSESIKVLRQCALACVGGDIESMQLTAKIDDIARVIELVPEYAHELRRRRALRALRRSLGTVLRTRKHGVKPMLDTTAIVDGVEVDAIERFLRQLQRPFRHVRWQAKALQMAHSQLLLIDEAHLTDEMRSDIVTIGRCAARLVAAAERLRSLRRRVHRSGRVSALRRRLTNAPALVFNDSDGDCLVLLQAFRVTVTLNMLLDTDEDSFKVENGASAKQVFPAQLILLPRALLLVHHGDSTAETFFGPLRLLCSVPLEVLNAAVEPPVVGGDAQRRSFRVDSPRARFVAQVQDTMQRDRWLSALSQTSRLVLQRVCGLEEGDLDGVEINAGACTSPLLAPLTPAISPAELDDTTTVL